jgi:hypothetical protein
MSRQLNPLRLNDPQQPDKKTSTTHSGYTHYISSLLTHQPGYFKAGIETANFRKLQRIDFE